MMRVLAGCILFAIVSVCAAVPHFEDPQAQARYQSLTEELRCVICLNQSIASSTAPLARDMRQLVAEQIRAGATNAEIKNILVNRYGTFVLYDPPFMPATWVLWLGPGVLLFIALLVAGVLLVRSRKTRTQPVAVDRKRLDQVLRETERGERES